MANYNILVEVMKVEVQG